jgi:hypothetical protein
MQPACACAERVRACVDQTAVPRFSPPQESQQLPTLSFTRRSEFISKIYAVAGLMGNDHILPLRTGDALVQRRAAHGESPPLAQRATADCGAFFLCHNRRLSRTSLEDALFFFCFGADLGGVSAGESLYTFTSRNPLQTIGLLTFGYSSLKRLLNRAMMS